MEEVFINLAKQSPGLAVAIAIVVVFVRHLGRKDDQAKAVSDRCHEVQMESTTAIREMTKGMTEVTERLRFMNGKGRKK